MLPLSALRFSTIGKPILRTLKVNGDTYPSKGYAKWSAVSLNTMKRNAICTLSSQMLPDHLMPLATMG